MALLSNRRSVMTLYSEPNDPVSHCARIVLAEKDINVEVHYVEAGYLPDEIRELNPYNKVLTLIDRDLVLYDAQIIMEYLDERFPHPPLLPVDPVSRAGNRQIRARIIEDLYSLLDDLQGSNDTARAAAKKSMRENLTAISPALEQMPFFMSEEYSLSDCTMAPLLWRISSYGIKLPAQAKSLIAYGQRMFQRDAFIASMSSVEKEIQE